LAWSSSCCAKHFKTLLLMDYATITHKPLKDKAHTKPQSTHTHTHTHTHTKNTRIYRGLALCLRPLRDPREIH
ncbi:MAG: hypothetical protein J8272_00615, partial ['Prunus persica' phytoplasma PP2]|nr:hypothetical protein ['Prunus persica' phytoplasma PP2]